MEMESSAAGARGGEEDRGPSQAAARVEHGFGHWHCVARRMPAPGRSARSCRDRWRHHLARDVYHRPFTARDDDELRRLVARYGGRWKDIGRAVYGRTSRVMRRRWKEIQIRERPAAQKSGGEDIAEEPLQQGQGCYYADDDILASAFASCNLTMDAMDPWAGSLALGFACMAV